MDKLNNKASVVNLKDEKYDIYIGRPSKFGNPFSHKKETLAKFKVNSRSEAIRKYKEWILSNPHELIKLEELRGKKLGCWCKPKSCHGDIIIEILNNNQKKLF